MANFRACRKEPVGASVVIGQARRNLDEDEAKLVAQSSDLGCEARNLRLEPFGKARMRNGLGQFDREAEIVADRLRPARIGGAAIRTIE